MIDVAHNQPIPLRQAARDYFGNPSNATLWRWMLKGVKGVRLSTIVIGGRRYLTRAAAEEFIHATTAAANRGERMPTRTARQRDRDIEAARRELAAD
jgi:hypothetical protein